MTKEPEARREATRLAGDIEHLRGDLGEIVAELDRRRHEMFDVRLQLQRHPVAAGIAAATVAAAIGGTIALAVHRRRQARRPVARFRQARAALARLLDDPHRVAKEPSVATKIAAAAGAAAATTLAKRLVERAVRPPVRAAARA